MAPTNANSILYGISVFTAKCKPPRRINPFDAFSARDISWLLREVWEMSGKADRRPTGPKSKSLFFSLCLFLTAFISRPGASFLAAAEAFRWASLSHPLRLGSLSVEQGLSQSSVFCTLQDRRGFLWFGTEDGLNRYDGYSFRIFRPDVNDPRSISSNFILSLAEDPRGRIWVGTSGGD